MMTWSTIFTISDMDFEHNLRLLEGEDDEEGD